MPLKLANYNEGTGEVRGILCLPLRSFLRLWGFLYILFYLYCISLEYSRMIDSADIQLTTAPSLKITKNNEKGNFS